ncbi:MAG: hypothetical protein JWM33_3613 [Caulobacteraceae bacterium]|nr:hypothetical protein [Caulobacteraceae bacterium]
MNIEAIIQHLKTGDNVDAQMEDFERLDRGVTRDDLPILLSALRSEDAGSWLRELISQPVIRIGGVSVLPDVLRAFDRNFREGHDNDSLCGLLADFAEENRVEVKKALDAIEPEHDGILPETIDWLFEYCEADDNGA